MSMRSYRQHRGISMLECLCVISLAAAVLLLAISRYRTEQKTQVLSLVKLDVKRLSYALRTYVYDKGCYSKDSEQAGYFAGNTEPSLSDLEEKATDLPVSRRSLVHAYSVLIDDTPNADPSNGPLVYHRLWVKAELSSSNADRTSSLASLLGAEIDPNQADTLKWSISMIDPKSSAQSTAMLGFLSRASEQQTDSDKASHSLAACWLKEAA